MLLIVQRAEGLESGGIAAPESTGTYWIFRHLLRLLDIARLNEVLIGKRATNALIASHGALGDER